MIKPFLLKIKTQILTFLKQGMTPHKLALTLALGIIFGAFPVIGPTTLLCTFAAFAFRVNLAAIQFVNYITYPIQILCIIPLYKAGAYIFKDDSFNLSVGELLEMAKADLWGTLSSLWWSTLHAVVAWLIIAPIAALIIYLISYPILKLLLTKKALAVTLPA